MQCDYMVVFLSAGSLGPAVLMSQTLRAILCTTDEVLEWKK